MAPLVRLVLASPIATAVHGEREIDLEFEGTLAGLLEAAARRYGSGFRARLFDGDGRLKRFLNVFVNGEDARYLWGLESPVPRDATVDVLPAIAGG